LFYSKTNPTLHNMSNTPSGQSQRKTRANSHAQAITLADIKNLIENSKEEIMETVRGEVSAVKKEIVQLNHKISCLTARVQEMEGDNLELRARLKDLDSRVIGIESEKKRELSVDELIQETEERLKRRKYLIVSGVAEQASGTVEERKQKDTEFIKVMSQSIGVNDFSPEEVCRVGKISLNRPRLLRFKCSTQEEKQTLLRESRKLKKIPSLSGVFINPDQTLTQRKRSLEIRKELRARREAGENVVVRNGSVVNMAQSQHFH